MRVRGREMRREERGRREKIRRRVRRGREEVGWIILLSGSGREGILDEMMECKAGKLGMTGRYGQNVPLVGIGNMYT